MSKNNKLLKEAFFKKSYTDKMKGKLPTYEPVGPDTLGNLGIGGILNTDGRGGFAVNDPQEAGKRLVGAFGAALTTNTVKNVASRSVKTFPVIVSDNVSPETSVMLKRLMEEQYAEYISLAISNKIVDLSQYDTRSGNIALQAIDNLSGHDFSKRRIANIARGGELSADDLFKNYSAYNLIRNEGAEYISGHPIIDTLLEGAIIVEDASKVNEVAQVIYDNILAEEKPEWPFKEPREVPGITVAKTVPLSNIFDDVDADTIIKSDKALATTLGKASSSGRLLSPSIVVDSKRAADVLDRSIAEMLLRPENRAIKDRFEKATFLLESGRIAGGEYIDYLVSRLGIPINRSQRIALVTEYKTANIRKIGDYDTNKVVWSEKNKKFDIIDGRLTADEIRRVSSGTLLKGASKSSRALKTVLSLKGKILVGALSIAAATSGVGAAGTAALAASIPAFAMFLPAMIVTSAVAGVGALVAYILGRRKISKHVNEKTLGWERVELLIDALYASQKEVRDKSEEPQLPNMPAFADKTEIENALDAYTKTFDNFLESSKKESVNASVNYAKGLANMIVLDEDLILNAQEGIKVLNETLEADKEYQAELLEAKISTTRPQAIKYVKKYAFDTKAKPDLQIVPDFAASSMKAYGEVEYDKRELKDRKYNAPLLMTVKFTQRFSDGTLSDKEMTAVIGILGVITRVPSEEMTYILKANADNKTIKGIFSQDGSLGSMVTDLLGTTRLSKDIESLPVSKEVWDNLEKVSRLAIANKLAGKKDDNVANAHIVFSQQELDNVRADIGVDYLRDKKLTYELMKRYSAFTLMIANDVSERLYVFDDPENVSWDVVPYSALRGKDTGENLAAVLGKLQTGRIG